VIESQQVFTRMNRGAKMINVRTWFNKVPLPGSNVNFDQKIFGNAFPKNNPPLFIPLQVPGEVGVNFNVTAIVKGHNDQKYDTSIFLLEANCGNVYLWQSLEFRDDCGYYFFCATPDVYENNKLVNTNNALFTYRGVPTNMNNAKKLIKNFENSLAATKKAADANAGEKAAAGGDPQGGLAQALN